MPVPKIINVMLLLRQAGEGFGGSQHYPAAARGSQASPTNLRG